VEATLETMCDYLRTEKAFVARFNNGDINLTQQVGELAFSEDDLQNEIEFLRELATSAERVAGRSAFQSWEGYQLVPLYSKRTSNNTATGIIGLLGIFLSQNPTDIIDDDEDTTLLYTLVQRAEQSLDDMLLQDEIFASLEGLLPQFHMTHAAVLMKLNIKWVIKCYVPSICQKVKKPMDWCVRHYGIIGAVQVSLAVVY
ncbi:MAG: hypothetical protein Q9P01_12935, partial [Anaerolineae bacterium]|nr:hypothetical protein [Anaerolineae bacterium]